MECQRDDQGDREISGRENRISGHCSPSKPSGQLLPVAEEMDLRIFYNLARRIANISTADAESIVREIKRRTQKKYYSEEKIQIVLEGLRGEISVAELRRKEGIQTDVYGQWSNDRLINRLGTTSEPAAIPF
jgi:transposase